MYGSRFCSLFRRKKLPTVQLHDPAHSFASLSLVAGADLKLISSALGHSTIAVTPNVYAHVAQKAAQNQDFRPVAWSSMGENGCHRRQPFGNRARMQPNERRTTLFGARDSPTHHPIALTGPMFEKAPVK
jgi:hypothetical protein